MRVLGIDPGVARTGFAVIERTPKGPKALDIGVIQTPGSLAHEERLATLFERMTEILRAATPEALAIERLFFNANVRTAMAVGQASGVTLLAAAMAGLAVAHYTPTEVKQSVVGVGSADKAQVQAMVKAVLGLAAIPRPSDAADACALAICHINRSGLARAIKAASA